MTEFKNVMTTENLIDYLDQKPRVDSYSGNVYFSCPYCKQEALEMLKAVLSKKAFKNVENLDLEFGTLIFNPETHDIACSSRPNSHYDDEHAIEIEAEMVKWHLQGMDYGEYLNMKFDNLLASEDEYS